MLTDANKLLLQGMEDLIRQAFLHVEIIGPHVAEGHYDLVGPNGEIILPQVWETMVEPDWIITMHMWPMPEPPKPEDPPPSAEPIPEVPPPPPPAPEAPEPVLVPDGMTLLKMNRSKRAVLIISLAKNKKKPKPTSFMAWTAGSRKAKSLKVAKKT